MKAKATELMIGDWVYGLVVDEGNDLDKIIDRVPSKVTMINEFGDIYTQGPFPIDDEEYDGEWEWYDIEPIPLTPEILEKNGFSFCTRDGGYYLYATMSCGFDVEVILFDVVNKYASIQLHIGDTDDTATYIHLMECDCVHQLQHALRLCGIDKEITI